MKKFLMRGCRGLSQRLYLRTKGSNIAQMLAVSGAVKCIPDRSVRLALNLDVARAFARSGDFKKSRLVWKKLSKQDPVGKISQYEIIAGALGLFDLDSEGADIIARGFRHPSCNVHKYLYVCGLPQADIKWIADNYSRFQEAAFWSGLARTASGNSESLDIFRLRLALIVLLTGERHVGLAMLAQQRKRSRRANNKERAGILAIRSFSWTKRSIPPPDLERCDPEDTDAHVVYDLIVRAQRGDAHRYGEGYLSKPISPSLRATLSQRHLWTLVTAFQALQQRNHVLAFDTLTQALREAAGQLKDLETRPPIKKVFAAGFGRSGSSAVYDAMRSYPGVNEMLGAGDVPHMNEGADSEPMYIQGPSGFGRLISELDATGGNPR